MTDRQQRQYARDGHPYEHCGDGVCVTCERGPGAHRHERRTVIGYVCHASRVIGSNCVRPTREAHDG